MYPREYQLLLVSWNMGFTQLCSAVPLWTAERNAISLKERQNSVKSKDETQLKAMF